MFSTVVQIMANNTRVIQCVLVSYQLTRNSKNICYLCQSVILKRDLSQSPKAELSIQSSILIPVLTSGLEPWLLTERMRLQMQASEIRFLPGLLLCKLSRANLRVSGNWKKRFYYQWSEIIHLVSNFVSQNEMKRG